MPFSVATIIDSIEPSLFNRSLLGTISSSSGSTGTSCVFRVSLLVCRLVVPIKGLSVGPHHALKVLIFLIDLALLLGWLDQFLGLLLGTSRRRRRRLLLFYHHCLWLVRTLGLFFCRFSTGLTLSFTLTSATALFLLNLFVVRVLLFLSQFGFELLLFMVGLLLGAVLNLLTSLGSIFDLRL